MKKIILGIIALTWVTPIYSSQISYQDSNPSQYQVNHSTQFPAQNQFFIDDFNRMQDQERQQRLDSYERDQRYHDRQERRRMGY